MGIQKKYVYKTLAVNTSSNGFFFIVQQGLQLLTFAVLIRILGLEEYGLLLLAGALIGQFAFLDGGLSAGLQKFIPEFRVSQNSDNIGRAFLGTLICFVGMGVFVSLILVCIIMIDGVRIFGVSDISAANQVIAVAAIISVFQWPMQVFENAGKGFNLFHQLNVIQFFESIIISSLTIFAALVGFPVVWIFVIRFLPRFGSTYFRWRLLQKHQNGPLIVIDRQVYQIIRIMFSYSGWVFLMGLSSTLVNQFDKILVSAILNVNQLPIYIGVNRVLKIVIQITSILKSAVLPIASGINADNDQQFFNEFCFRGTRIFNAVFAPLTVSIIIFAKPILNIIGGPSVADYAWALQLGSILYLPVICRAFLNTAVIGSGKIIRVQSGWSIATAIIYLIICLIGLYGFGLTGAILAHPITHVIMMPAWLYIVVGNIDFKQFSFWKAVALGQWPAWALLLFSYPYIHWFSPPENVKLTILFFIIFSMTGLIFSWYLSVEKVIRMETYKMIKKYFWTSKINKF